jgi:hypothetical protein
MIVDGSNALVATEISLLLNQLRKQDKEIIPVVLSCIYTDGGHRKLNKSLEEFQEDTSAVLKKIEQIERQK